VPTRRRVLQAAAAAAVAAPAVAEPPRPGRVKQSLVYWCLNARGDKWDAERVCEVAKELGVPSVELIGPEHWAVLRKHGLTCAIAPNGMPGAPFMRGFNNRAFHAELLDRTGRAIDACADARFPAVIAFVGYKWRNPDDPASGAIPADEAAANCVAGLKDLARAAERRGVTVCLEHLNTRNASDPMKGHPGYQGDDLDFCADVLRKVGSPRVKLLFDIYHVQLMHGDLIRRIEANKDLIGHVHTAGVPGRGELDENQEVNYPAVMRKLVAVGYAGFVGQEFIPTRNVMDGLRQAVRLCDV
jgi:sugar phosphate isomerase/epimerase